MSWIFLALGSCVAWGLANLADKYIIGNRVKNIYVFLLWSYVLGAVISGIAAFFIPLELPNTRALIWLTIAGVIYTIGTVWYFKALEIDEVSRINIWWNLAPVFTLLVGWLAINELPNQIQLVAMVILIVGSTIASVKFVKGQKLISPGLWWIIAACLEFSIYLIIIRFVSTSASPAFIFIYTNIIQFFTALFFFWRKSFREAFVIDTKKLTVSVAVWVIAAMGIDHLGTFLNQLAIKQGPAALVSSLVGFQTLFVFFSSTLITRWKPDSLNETLDRKNLAVKCIAVLFIIVGIIILAYS